MIRCILYSYVKIYITVLNVILCYVLNAIRVRESVSIFMFFSAQSLT